MLMMQPKKCQPKLQWHTDLCQTMQHVHLLQNSPALRQGSLHTLRSRFFGDDTASLHAAKSTDCICHGTWFSLDSRRNMFAHL